MRTLATVPLLALLLTAPAGAQPAGPPPGNPAVTPALTPEKAPGMPAPHQPNPTDRVFVQAAATGGKAEVELGQLAQRAGADAAVKDFAKRMVEDHGKANERLAALAKAAGLAVPDGLDPEHQAVRDRLARLGGAELDRAYIAGQVADHQKTAQLLAHEIGSGQDEGLKGFAAESLPVVLEHLRLARDIQARLATARVP